MPFGNAIQFFFGIELQHSNVATTINTTILALHTQWACRYRPDGSILKKAVLMYVKILVLVNLMAFAFVASQPLFYLMAFSQTQKALRATAYIELRKQLDKSIKPILSLAYYFTMATMLLLLIAALQATDYLLLSAALIAIAALITDIVLALKTNIPINNIISQWDADDYPRHWQLFRKKWFYFYHMRQAAGLVGFAALLFGAVFR